ncbi:hypothetical protein GKQ77_32425 [Streptomyces sp. BG9H]|uniref:Uncharacterized protein n=1 Tax=Streptomyces anatolicus TaxID=2675858 RepID=A0ABS6YXT0_9ACTN|nr:hypothetical protein [Streptomyces anatolicus]MBW5426209.1 hypothetical protein [Streptomyces anatolicus]
MAPNAAGTSSTGTTAPRLLPWSTPDGNPCYLIGDGTGHVSRIADNIESIQLGMADELPGYVGDLVDDPKATAPQLRYLAARMAESLRDVTRIARSRGARLPAPACDDDPEEEVDEEEEEEEEKRETDRGLAI